MILSINKVESDIKVLWAKWQIDALRIWKQSPVMVLIIAISQIVFGLLPYLIVRWFGDLIDTIQGARSLGLWTDAMNSAMWTWIGLVILISIIVYTTRQFRGASALVARGVRWFALIVSSLIVLLPVAPIVVLMIGLLMVAEIWIEKRLRSLLWLVIFACLAWLYWSSAQSIVYHVFTIGEGLTYAGLLCVIPARQFFDRYFVSGSAY